MRNLRRVLGYGIPALVAGMLYVPSSAAAQEVRPQDVSSVGVLPIGTKTSDPNSGQWFIAALGPGDSKHFDAAVTNPATIPQRVKLYLADLDFTANGAPEVAEVSDEVGTWGSVDQPSVEVPPLGTVKVGFTIRVPSTGDPGDHLGVLVAEGEPAGGGNVKVIKRVATRIYITLPGDAQPAVNIQKLTTQKDSSFLTKEITTRVILQNTGRVRLHPTVLVNGTKAAGPDLIMSRSVEEYVATTKVPIWGGPQGIKVDVQTKIRDENGKNGPVRQARASVFVIPWILLIALGLFFALAFLGRRAWRNRGGKYAEMRADMRRIERLLAEQRAGGPIDARDDDPETAIKAAIKRAGRAGDKDSEEKLKEKLAEHRATKQAEVVEPAVTMSSEPDSPAPAEPVPVVDAPPPSPEPVAPPQAVAPPDQAVPPAPAAVGERIAAKELYEFLREDSPSEPDEKPVPAVDFYESLRAGSTEPPPPVKVDSPAGPGFFVPDPNPAPPAPAAPATAAPDADAGDVLSILLRELANAPAERRDALIKAARAYGIRELRTRADVISALPEELRAQLLPQPTSQQQ